MHLVLVGIFMLWLRDRISPIPIPLWREHGPYLWYWAWFFKSDINFGESLATNYISEGGVKYEDFYLVTTWPDMLKELSESDFLTTIPKPFVLVSVGDDRCVPSEVMDKNAYHKILETPGLVGWWTQNIDATLPAEKPELNKKVHPIPIGIDLHQRASQYHIFGGIQQGH